MLKFEVLSNLLEQRKKKKIMYIISLNFWTFMEM